MSKRVLFLLPIALFALVGCKNSGGKASGDVTSSEEEEPEEVVIPTVLDGDLKTAYDAAAALAKGGDTGETSYTFSGTVVSKCGNSWFVQKGYSGLYFYNTKIDGNAPAIGRNVSVTTKLCNYNGMLESKSGTSTASFVDAETHALEDEIHLCGAGQLAQLRQNIRVSVKVKVTDAFHNPWSSEKAPFLEGKVLNRDNEVADIKIKFDKYAFSGASAEAKEVLNAAAIGDVLELHNLVTTAYDDAAGSPTPNQLIAGESVTAVKLAAE